MSSPRLVCIRADDLPRKEVVARKRGDERVSARENLPEWAADGVVGCTRCDPHAVVESRGRERLVPVLEGGMTAGERHHRREQLRARIQRWSGTLPRSRRWHGLASDVRARVAAATRRAWRRERGFSARRSYASARRR
jgi:hypothetical protein